MGHILLTQTVFLFTRRGFSSRDPNQWPLGRWGGRWWGRCRVPSIPRVRGACASVTCSGPASRRSQQGRCVSPSWVSLFLTHPEPRLGDEQPLRVLKGGLLLRIRMRKWPGSSRGQNTSSWGDPLSRARACNSLSLLTFLRGFRQLCE